MDQSFNELISEMSMSCFQTASDYAKIIHPDDIVNSILLFVQVWLWLQSRKDLSPPISKKIRTVCRNMNTLKNKLKKVRRKMKKRLPKSPATIENVAHEDIDLQPSEINRVAIWQRQEYKPDPEPEVYEAIDPTGQRFQKPYKEIHYSRHNENTQVDQWAYVRKYANKLEYYKKIQPRNTPVTYHTFNRKMKGRQDICFIEQNSAMNRCTVHITKAQNRQQTTNVYVFSMPKTSSR
uniref:Uncharacterized protein LOC116948079 n=1 Tax=Petromyzon marinus TaxID=7757 RepID=A0AAJ7TLL7_PETMA|nr:uncharacterized protein LOC116948079 [Petromyzon marinus]